MFHSSLVRSGTRGELSIVSGSRAHGPSAELVLVGEPPIIPSRGAERVCQCEHAAVHLSVPIRSFPAKTAAPDAHRRSHGFRGSEAPSGAAGGVVRAHSQLPSGQSASTPPAPCPSAGCSTSSQTLSQEGRGRAESPTPLGTDSRPQTFSPFSAPGGKTVGKNQWVRPAWGVGKGHEDVSNGYAPPGAWARGMGGRFSPLIS